jgi:hypothetical protein
MDMKLEPVLTGPDRGPRLAREVHHGQPQGHGRDPEGCG